MRVCLLLQADVGEVGLWWRCGRRVACFVFVVFTVEAAPKPKKKAFALFSACVFFLFFFCLGQVRETDLERAWNEVGRF